MSATLMGAAQVKSDQASLDGYFRQVEDFAAERTRFRSRSAAVAWAVAGASCLSTLAMAGSCAFVLTRQVDPIVLRVNDTTGMVDRIYDGVGGEMAATEADDRHWCWQFILNAEGYEPSSAKLKFDTVMLMASPDVQKQYAERVRGSNPLSPQVILGPQGQASLSWNSTSFIAPGIAQVRFTEVDRKQGSVLPARHMLATIGFTFVRGPTFGSTVNTNPRGFLVTSYRLDQEDAQ